MAISHPRFMPDNFVSSQIFEPWRLDYLSPTQGGRLGAVSAGPALWRASWTIGQLRPDKSDELRAWLTSLRGPLRAFYGRDHLRSYPKLHPTGFAHAGGWSVNSARDVLTLTGVSGLSLSIGDYVGFLWGGNATKVRCVEAAAASGSTLAGVTVEPPLPAVVPPSALAYFNKPTVLMRLDPDGTRIGDSGPLGQITGAIAAVQDLRA